MHHDPSWEGFWHFARTLMITNNWMSVSKLVGLQVTNGCLHWDYDYEEFERPNGTEVYTESQWSLITFADNLLLEGLPISLYEELVSILQCNGCPVPETKVMDDVVCLKD